MHAVVNMKSRFNLAWLASSGPSAAKRALTEARSAWVDRREGVQIQQLWLFLADVDVALYREQANEACELVAESRDAIRKSLLGQSPNLSLQAEPDQRGPGSLCAAVHGQGAWAWSLGKEGGQASRLHVSERSYGAFQRVFTFPESVDAASVTAKSTHGLLEITIDKAPEAQPHKIQISSE